MRMKKYVLLFTVGNKSGYWYSQEGQVNIAKSKSDAIKKWKEEWKTYPLVARLKFITEIEKISLNKIKAMIDRFKVYSSKKVIATNMSKGTSMLPNTIAWFPGAPNTLSRFYNDLKRGE